MEEPTFNPMAHKASSPTLSTFAPSKILPAPLGDLPSLPPGRSQYADSANESDTNKRYVEDQTTTAERARKHMSIDNSSAYDLAAPPPRISHGNAELLAERLFSEDHLHIILKDSSLSVRFTQFLNRYRPQAAPLLIRYLKSQKALTAIRYANALADQMSPQPRLSLKGDGAVVDTKFESYSKKALSELVSDALPAYITFRLVSVVTDCLVKEITGDNTPLMQELIQGLAEVYCMTDPNLPDNPIVFASKEFYNTTQYGQDYVIGKNCRFLQGPKTQPQAVKRISEAIRNRLEVCEILINYKRDGSPFLNLVMMAPLMDHRGNARYYIGCQIDISHLIEGGRGLESFKILLDKDREAIEKPLPDPLDQKPPLKVLRELGSLLNNEEIQVMHDGSHRSSIDSGRSTPVPSTPTRPARRFVGMDDMFSTALWPPNQFGPSGRLPGVYQNYLLVRPHPSLRIIFTSAALRIPGLSQSRLMDHIGGPSHLRESLLEALKKGAGVTAKISWLSHSPRQSGSQSHTATEEFNNASVDYESLEGRPRWIHCTHLLGSDSRSGVIMVVMVDKEEVTGTLNASPSHQRVAIPMRHRDMTIDGWPLRGMGASHFTSAKLYAEYMRREGRSSLERNTGRRHSIDSERSGASTLDGSAGGVFGGEIGRDAGMRSVTPSTNGSMRRVHGSHGLNGTTAIATPMRTDQMGGRRSARSLRNARES